MKKYFLLTIIIYLPLLLFAQLKVETNYTASSLVKDVLLGPGVIAQNIKFKGSNKAIGKFKVQKNNELQIDSGMILSTGLATDAIGPNTSDLSPGGGNNEPGDGDLDKLLKSKFVTRDAAVLEFDFYPNSSSISFSYVFASEEYLQFVQGDYNDVFGFFVSGPGITGVQNLALVPGTQEPVSVKSIHPGKNPGYYIDNPVGVGQVVSYNGLTRKLTASLSNLQFCKAYHIKIAIQDVKDLTFDSSIFLEAQSFSSGSAAIPKLAACFPLGSISLAEGCGKAGFVFTKSVPIGEAQTFSFNLGGDAEFGNDYTFLNGGPNNTFTVAAGKEYDTLFVSAIKDGQAEGLESLVLKLVNLGSCLQLQTSIPIIDLDPFEARVSLPQCSGPKWFVSGVGKGGSGSVDCEWYDDQGKKLSSSCAIEIEPDAPVKTYKVKVKDRCTGENGEATVDLRRITPIKLAANFIDTTLCKGASVKLMPAPGSPALVYTWETSDFLDDPQSSTPTSTPPYSIRYTLSTRDPNYCPEPANVQINVFQPDLGQDTVLMCIGGNVKLSAFGGDSYTWSPAIAIDDITSAQPIVSPLSGQQYKVKVTSTALNCAAEDSVYVKVDKPIEVNLGEDKTVCKRSLVAFQAPKADYYEWSPARFVDYPNIQSPNGNPFFTTIFEVKVFSGACIRKDDIKITVIEEPKADFVFSQDPCSREILFQNKSEDDYDEFKWFFGDGATSSEKNPGSHLYKTHGEYDVRLIVNPSIILCNDTIDKKIVFEKEDVEKLMIPNVFTPNGDELNDTFTITGGLTVCKAEHMVIYNRWGAELFSTDDREKFFWDGTIAGKPAPDGVYYYVIRGKGFYKGGSVTLLR